jgi:hypothetical protein
VVVSVVVVVDVVSFTVPLPLIPKAEMTAI